MVDLDTDELDSSADPTPESATTQDEAYLDLGDDPAGTVADEAHRFGLRITSGQRSVSHNAAVGGAPDSYHLHGQAYDLAGPQAKMRGFTNYMNAVYGPNLRELFHDPVGGWKSGQPVGAIGGHANHVHVAWNQPSGESGVAGSDSVDDLNRGAARILNEYGFDLPQPGVQEGSRSSQQDYSGQAGSIDELNQGAARILKEYGLDLPRAATMPPKPQTSNAGATNPAGGAGVVPGQDKPIRASADTTTGNDLNASVPTLGVRDYESPEYGSGGTGRATRSDPATAGPQDVPLVPKPFVVSDPDELEQQVEGKKVQFLDRKGIAQCALLPGAWENQRRHSRFWDWPGRHTDRMTREWIMGEPLTYGMDLQKGTVVATFNRSTGKYAQTGAGMGGQNHTAIFLRWGEEDGQQGMWVAQQMSGLNGRAIIGFIPFKDDNPYYSNADRFNLVQIKSPMIWGLPSRRQ